MEKMEKMTILVDLEELHFVLLAFHGEIYEIKVKGSSVVRLKSSI